MSTSLRQADVDLVEAASAVVFARCLHHNPAGGYAPEAILEADNVLGNDCAQGLARLHSLEVDLDGALHAYPSYRCPISNSLHEKPNWERASSRWSGSSGIPSRYEAVRLLCRRAASARKSSQSSSVPSPRPSQARATRSTCSSSVNAPMKPRNSAATGSSAWSSNTEIMASSVALDASSGMVTMSLASNSRALTTMKQTFSGEIESAGVALVAAASSAGDALLSGLPALMGLPPRSCCPKYPARRQRR